MEVRTSSMSMVRFATAALAGLLLAGPAAAQFQRAPGIQHRETNASRQARIQRTIEDTYSHRWEIFGGGGYMRFRSGQSLKRNNEVSWAMSANYFLNPQLYVTGHAQGSFGYANVNINPYGVYNPQINEYMFTGGVGERIYRREKIAIAPEVTAGVGWGIFSGGSKAIPGYKFGIYQDGIRPAISAGVNLDYNIYSNLAFRTTPYWMGTMFSQADPNTGASTSSGVQSNFGFNAGIVYRFGRQ